MACTSTTPWPRRAARCEGNAGTAMGPQKAFGTLESRSAGNVLREHAVRIFVVLQVNREVEGAPVARDESRSVRVGRTDLGDDFWIREWILRRRAPGHLDVGRASRATIGTLRGIVNGEVVGRHDGGTVVETRVQLGDWDWRAKPRARPRRPVDVEAPRRGRPTAHTAAAGHSIGTEVEHLAVLAEEWAA